MADKVLIVDCDQQSRTTLCRVVKNAGMEYDAINDNKHAIICMESQEYALIMIDVNMNGIDGFEAIHELRTHGVQIPIMIVTDRHDDFDVMYGLDMGADDYIIKPFNPVILGAKAKALIRRSRCSGSSTIIAAGPFSYNTSTLRVFKNGRELILTSRENSMMKLFLDNINRIFSKNALYQAIWNEDAVDDNTIIVCISRLRSKIEEDPSNPKHLQTVRGLGYRFVI